MTSFAFATVENMADMKSKQILKAYFVKLQCQKNAWRHRWNIEKSGIAENEMEKAQKHALVSYTFVQTFVYRKLVKESETADSLER